ncbi:unnamed protein product [Peronospora belbahrii]|uniref:Uncharacterized protein n=1 Tax=Peronospora belbahrii TaxID=622444 RepID=A0AAU9KKU6_9STRA|nr:unnamed protein product [Peronospora belbahrii]
MNLFVTTFITLVSFAAVANEPRPVQPLTSSAPRRLVQRNGPGHLSGLAETISLQRFRQTLDGQGAWYWRQGTSILRPIFFPNGDRLGLDYLGLYDQELPVSHIQHRRLQENDSHGNECTESHGISIGSVGGNLVDDSTTVSDFVAQDNTITNSLNGLRIKAVADLKGMVDNVKVTISEIKVDGLSGSASQVYDIVVNPNMVSMWTFTGITVTGAKGTCTGQPTGIC